MFCLPERAAWIIWSQVRSRLSRKCAQNHAVPSYTTRALWNESRFLYPPCGGMKPSGMLHRLAIKWVADKRRQITNLEHCACKLILIVSQKVARFPKRGCKHKRRDVSRVAKNPLSSRSRKRDFLSAGKGYPVVSISDVTRAGTGAEIGSMPRRRGVAAAARRTGCGSAVNGAGVAGVAEGAMIVTLAASGQSSSITA